jgi:hypothetical protein
MNLLQGNLFARVLQSILSTKDPDLRLGHLDDRGDFLKRVHPEKVRRLQQSLNTPGKFPTLNPAELENVIETFHLEEERLHLRAAILATSVEKLLYDQGMTSVGALRAAEQVMPVILDVLQDVVAEEDFVGTFRDEDSEEQVGATLGEAQAAMLDGIMENALRAIDRGTLALHLVIHGQAFAEKQERAHEAVAAFELALQQLLETERRVESDPTFLSTRTQALERVRQWRGEAENGKEMAQGYLP